MGQKRTPALIAAAKRLRAEGRSYQEVAEALSKPGKTVSKAAVIGWLRESPAGSAAVPESRPPVRPAPVGADPVAVGDIGPEELRALLAGELRRHQAEADRAMDDGRPGDARQSSRLVAAFTAQLQRIHARADEDVDTVRVRAADMQAAADRAMAGLEATLGAVLAEVAGWEVCEACGEQHGDFAGGDVSPIRALMERAVRRIT